MVTRTKPREAAPKRKARDAHDSRRRILDAAEKEFAAKGFAGARLDAVAKGARLKPGLIHFHFGDKQGLYAAVLERAFAALDVQVQQLLALGPVGGEPSRAELRLFGEALVALTARFYTDNAQVLSLLRQETTGRTAGKSSAARRVAEKHLGPVYDVVIQRIDALREAGVIAEDVDARHLFVAVVSMTAYPIVEPIFAELVFGRDAVGEVTTARHHSFVVEMALSRMLPRS